jgi:murein L,D-transpeptidase YafK
MQRRTRIAALVLALGTLAVSGALLTDLGSSAADYLLTKMLGARTVADRLEEHAGNVASRLEPQFLARNLPYPPRDVAYVAIKDRRELHVYARADERDAWTFVQTYAVHGQSGTLGPKLREGDKQVPEGIYGAASLNPNSRFHLSIRVGYPNAFDERVAAIDGRTNLGGDIMIHGASSSVGCLAIGNDAAEDLFVLTALVGTEHTRIVISPVDFRDREAKMPATDQPWVAELYATLRKELAEFPAPLQP